MFILFSLAVVVSLSLAQDFDRLIIEGDSLHSVFDNRGAEEKYRKALELEPSSAEALWRLSRTLVDIGEHQPEAEQESYFDSAVEYADLAIAADPQNPQGHLRRAIALGKLALFKGVFKSISLVKEVKASLDRCLELDENEPTAHYVLARTHFKLCEKPKIARKLLGLGWANLDVADAEFQKSIQLDSTFIMYRYDYAKLLIKLGRYDEAEKHLKKIFELAIRDEDDAEKKADTKRMLNRL